MTYRVTAATRERLEGFTHIAITTVRLTKERAMAWEAGTLPA